MNPAHIENRIQTICLMLLCTIAIGAALSWLQSVFVPFVLAIFLSLILQSVIDFQVRFFRMPRVLAMLMTLILCFLALLFLAGLVSSSVRQLAASAGAYQARVEFLVNDVMTRLPVDRLGLPPDTEFDLRSLFPVATTRTMMVKMTGSIIAVLSQLLLVMMFVLFLMFGRGIRGRPQTGGVLRDVERHVRRYIVTKTFLSAFTGVLVYVILQLLSVDYAISFGAFAFFLNFIPSFGSVIATLLPLPVVLLTPGGTWLSVVLALALPGSVQFTVGYIIEPKIMGDYLDLHPVTILLSLIFWGTLWGLVGMFLAVPITAVLKITFEKLEITAPVAHLLAGRFSPPEAADDSSG